MDKFSLFDLERIDINELKAQFPLIDGKNEYDFRTNVALALAKEGKLSCGREAEDCPLFAQNEEARTTFHFLLSNTPDEIRSTYNSSLTKAATNSNMWKQYRIIFIYAIWMEKSLIRVSHGTIFPKYSVKYDREYLNELEKLSTNNLIYISEKLSQMSIKHHCIYHIYKELSIRIYNDLEILNDFFDGNYNELIITLPYLMILCEKNNDTKKQSELHEIFPEIFNILNSHTRHIYNKVLFDINLNRETTRIYYNDIIYSKDEYRTTDIMSHALISVTKSGQYPEITYETFVDIVRFLLEKYEGDCNDFFRFFTKDVNFRKYANYIASALFRICGKDFSLFELVLKGQIISHISEGYYQ